MKAVTSFTNDPEELFLALPCGLYWKEPKAQQERD